MCWRGRQTSASLTALPLTGSHRATHWALWAAASAPLKLQVISIATRLCGGRSDIICMKGLSSPVLISKWQLLLLVFPKATASNCLLPWYFFSLTGYLWRIDFLGFIFGLSKNIRNFNTWTFVASVPQNCWVFPSCFWLWGNYKRWFNKAWLCTFSRHERSCLVNFFYLKFHDGNCLGRHLRLLSASDPSTYPWDLLSYHPHIQTLDLTDVSNWGLGEWRCHLSLYLSLPLCRLSQSYFCPGRVHLPALPN